MSSKNAIYLIENGDVFEGTLRQFDECFVDSVSYESKPHPLSLPATEESVRTWCAHFGYSLSIK